MLFSRSLYRMYKSSWSILDWIYPPLCGGCNQTGYRWCDECQKKVMQLPMTLCECCGNPLPKIGLCEKCIKSKPVYHALRSYAVYDGPLKNAIHRLKYRRDIALGETLAHYLAIVYQKYNWKIDLVVPVPLGFTRRKERGYNQSSLLAWPFAITQRINYSNKAISRVRETQSQIHLSLDERKKNVAGAFKANPAVVDEKSIIIIDDVTTSGATIEACAKALIEAGAKLVFGLTVAKAVHINL